MCCGDVCCDDVEDDGWDEEEEDSKILRTETYNALLRKNITTNKTKNKRMLTNVVDSNDSCDVFFISLSVSVFFCANVLFCLY